ncbi:hypothetical protein HID58_061109, partial [Brassica napus]
MGRGKAHSDPRVSQCPTPLDPSFASSPEKKTRERVKGDVDAISTMGRNGALTTTVQCPTLLLLTTSSSNCSRGAKPTRLQQSKFFFFDVSSILPHPHELPNSTDRTCTKLCNNSVDRPCLLYE